MTLITEDGHVKNHRQVGISDSLLYSLAGLLLVACASPSVTEATSTAAEQQLPTTATVQEEVVQTTQARVTVTTMIESTTTSAADVQGLSRESWTETLLAAANQDDFGFLDPYAFASEEKRELFRTFVEFDLPRLQFDEPCQDLRVDFGCPISFDDTQAYWVTFNTDNGDLRFVDLIVLPRILDTIAADGAIGSGCSPGPGSLPDGEGLGNIAQRRSDEIEFDLFCLVPDEYVDWEPVNESADLRTVPVDPDVLVMELIPGELLQTGTTYGNWGTEPCDAEPCAVWISIRDGQVLYISEQFLS